jgi:hypothetical protein
MHNPHTSTPLKPGDVVQQQNGNGTVLTIITKYQSHHKLRHNTNQFIKDFNDGLMGLRRYCKSQNIKLIAMPRSGSGHDQLKWQYVEHQLYKVFKDLDTHIIIYSLPTRKAPPHPTLQDFMPPTMTHAQHKAPQTVPNVATATPLISSTSNASNLSIPSDK